MQVHIYQRPLPSGSLPPMAPSHLSATLAAWSKCELYWGLTHPNRFQRFQHAARSVVKIIQARIMDDSVHIYLMNLRPVDLGHANQGPITGQVQLLHNHTQSFYLMIPFKRPFAQSKRFLVFVTLLYPYLSPHPTELTINFFPECMNFLSFLVSYLSFCFSSPVYLLLFPFLTFLSSHLWLYLNEQR